MNHKKFLLLVFLTMSCTSQHSSSMVSITSNESHSYISSSVSINENVSFFSSSEDVQSISNSISSNSISSYSSEISSHEEEIDYSKYSSVQLTEALKIGINLGNSFECAINGFPDDNYANSIVSELGFEDRELFCEVRGAEDKYRGKITQETIDTIYRKGFRFIRLPVSWSNHLDENGKINTKWINRIKEVVDYVMQYDNLFIMINIMEQTTVLDTYGLNNEKFDFTMNLVKNVWTQVSEAFKDYDSRLLFENLNEPLDSSLRWNMNPTSNPSEYKECNENVMKLNQKFVDIVRGQGSENNKNRFLAIGNYGNIAYYAYGSDVQYISKWTLPNDTSNDKLICNFHDYAPQAFTYGNINEFNESTSNIASSDLELYNAYVSKGVGVTLSEWGSIFADNDARENERCNYSQYFMETATKNSIATLVWDNANRSTSWGSEYFGLLNRHKASGLYDNMVNKSGVKYDNEQTWFSNSVISSMFKGYYLGLNER